ncbi:MAG: methylated-DNA--[protein]-cysteine S-methyltransferase [Alphaproteobacteria bacterium]|nr:methylated-DNA--[protein]-cysteine S-methyltransferase [Alphaproteobacteria bacterium]
MGTLNTTTPVGVLALWSNGEAIIKVSWQENDTDAIIDDPDPVFREAAREIAAYFDGSLRNFSVATSFQGSSLQTGVWNAMTKIPFGSVLTYGDVARIVGSEPQAVGPACGQNPIPVIVPCHRIVGATGKLVGFSGGKGIETKAYLLDHESGQGRLL